MYGAPELFSPPGIAAVAALYNRGVMALANSGFWRLPVDGALHGRALDRHLLLNLWVMLGLVVAAHLVLAVGTVWGRARARRGARVEYAVLAGLTVLFFGLGVRAQQLWAAERYTGAGQYTGADAAAMQVEVTGMQFAWYFRYPGVDGRFGETKLGLASAAEGNALGIDPADRYGKDDVVTTELVLPAGREVDLTLHAQDVIHGFSVPEMRLKQNAVPGQTVHLHFTPERVGVYAVLCTQVCGLGHYRMSATMRVVTEGEFEGWLKGREVRR
jgi:cytochrome c oxidase subunit 2